MNIRVQQCDDSENYAEAPVLPIVYPTVDDAYFASGQITKAASGTGHEINFTKISEAKVGDEVYIIIAHTQLKDEPLEIQVLQGEHEVLVPKDQPLKIQHYRKEVTKISVKGDHLDPDPDGNPFTNAANYCDQTIVKVTLGPKSNKDFTTWNDKIAGCNDVAELYLKVDAHTANSVSPACFQYNGLRGFGAEADVTNRFLNKAGSWFGLKKKDCYCNRDLTEEEIKNIILDLRKSEKSVYQGSNKENLFWKSNCGLPKNDKTFFKFAQQINDTFTTYDVNTCIRKIHFLAQVYHETDRLRTTKEYSSSGSYAPYIGRGLMQLTWESNYQIYKSYSGVDCIKDPELIQNDLKNAIDSAGWFWKQGKVLSTGKNWSPPSSAPNYVTIHNPSYSKSTISFTKKDKSTGTYGTINFNLIADDDYVDVISWLVNGGSNGLTERQDYVKELKEIFKYDYICKNNP